MVSARTPRGIGFALLLSAVWIPQAGAAPAPAGSAEVPVQRPLNSVPVQPAPAPGPVAPAPAPQASSAPATDPGAIVSPAPAGDPSTAPAPSPVAQPTPTAHAPAEPAQPSQPGLAEQLLGPSVNQAPERRPVGPVRSENEAAETEDQAIAAMYRELYRPKRNPGRLHIIARAQFSFGSSFADHQLSGRTGGVHLDLGQSFNFIGYALSLRAEGGAIDVEPTRRTQITGLLGGGPTITLGRLGMLQRGYLDLRVGYDFLFAPARNVGADLTVTAAPAYFPHGPRAHLNMGLMINPGVTRKMFHGVGFSLGYQVLVGTFRGDLPASQFLSFGLHYWAS
jgi:hypothetical protein